MTAFTSFFSYTYLYMNIVFCMFICLQLFRATFFLYTTNISVTLLRRTCASTSCATFLKPESPAFSRPGVLRRMYDTRHNADVHSTLHRETPDETPSHIPEESFFAARSHTASTNTIETTPKVSPFLAPIAGPTLLDARAARILSDRGASFLFFFFHPRQSDAASYEVPSHPHLRKRRSESLRSALPA